MDIHITSATISSRELYGDHPYLPVFHYPVVDVIAGAIPYHKYSMIELAGATVTVVVNATGVKLKLITGCINSHTA